MKFRLCADLILRILFSRELDPGTTGFSQSFAPPLVPVVGLFHILFRDHGWAVLRLPILLKLSRRLRGASVVVARVERTSKTAVLGQRVVSFQYNHARTCILQERGIVFLSQRCG